MAEIKKKCNKKKPVKECPSAPGAVRMEASDRLSKGKRFPEWPDLPPDVAATFENARPMLVVPANNNKMRDQYHNYIKREDKSGVLRKKEGRYKVIKHQELWRMTSQKGGSVDGTYWALLDPGESFDSEEQFRGKYAVLKEWSDCDLIAQGKPHTKEEFTMEEMLKRAAMPPPKPRLSLCKGWIGPASSQPIAQCPGWHYPGGGIQIWLPDAGRYMKIDKKGAPPWPAKK